MPKPSDNSPLFEHWKTNKLISLKYNRAICLIASGYTSREVASYLEVSQRTVERWFSSEEFQVSLKYAISITLHAAIANAAQYCNHAVKTLINISEDSTTPFKYRLEAIRLILNFALQGQQTVKTEENPHVFEAQENHKQIHLFNASKNLASSQRSFSLPTLQTSSIQEDKLLWEQVFPDLPFPDEVTLKDTYNLEQGWDDELEDN